MRLHDKWTSQLVGVWPIEEALNSQCKCQAHHLTLYFPLWRMTWDHNCWSYLQSNTIWYSACCLVRPWMEELIPEKNSLEKIPKPLKRWMGRPQLLPEIVENVLRSLWWGNGSKQPSPCLQPPKVGGLLRHLLLLLKAPLTSLHFWSQIYIDFSQFWFRFPMNIFLWN